MVRKDEFIRRYIGEGNIFALHLCPIPSPTPDPNHNPRRRTQPQPQPPKLHTHLRHPPAVHILHLSRICYGYIYQIKHLQKDNFLVR